MKFTKRFFSCPQANSATFFLTKSDRISLETSWLKLEIWRVSVSINRNFFRCLNQVSHRNNQPLPVFNFLTWYEVWYLPSCIPLRISTNIPLAEQVDFDTINWTTWVIVKKISNWGEWPSGLRHCGQNRKVPSSNPTRCSARLRDQSWPWGSQIAVKKKSVNYTLFSPAPNDVTYFILLSRVITESNFNTVQGVKIKTYGGAYPILSSNHLCLMHNRLR